jgi:hypothetical protein
MTMDEMIAKRERVRRARVVTALVCLLVGIGCSALGATYISTNRYLMQHGVRTTGVVVANHRLDGRSGPVYYPDVQYVGPGNDTYVVEGGGNPTPQFRVGESVTVYYDPRDPKTALLYGADTDSVAWAFILMGCMFFFFFFALVTAVARTTLNSPAAARRRTLTRLHRLGGAALVWDASDGTHAIGGLHLQDAAGNRVPFRAARRWSEDPPSARACEQEACALAKHYSTEPGHYVLALPKGTVISTPRVGLSHRPAARLEPTPPQAPLPAQPERTSSRLGQAALVLVQPFLLVAIAVVVVAAITVVVVTITQQML